MRTVLISLLVAAALLVPAHADDDGDDDDGGVLRRLDVLGTWAFDCARPSGADNAVLVYAPGDDDDEPTEHITMGALDRVSEISDVTLLADGKVQWVQEGESGDLTIVNLIENGQRLKTWRSTSATGQVLISDGKFAAGDDTPWFNRCDARR